MVSFPAEPRWRTTTTRRPRPTRAGRGSFGARETAVSTDDIAPNGGKWDFAESARDDHAIATLAKRGGELKVNIAAPAVSRSIGRK